MVATLCTSAMAIQKAGINANATLVATAATILLLIEEAEGVINAETGYDWVTDIALIGANYKGMLSAACSCLTSLAIITYDTDGYSLASAQTILDINTDVYLRAIKKLKEVATRKIMGAVS